MRYRLLVSISVLTCFAISCSKGSDGQAPPAPAQKDADLGHEAAKSSCPWNFQSSKTVANYQSLGVDVQLNCKAIAPNSGFSYRYTQEDLTKILGALDESFAIVTNSNHRPAVIKIGKRTFHQPKDNSIQLMLGDDTFLKDVPHYLDATMQIMNVEQSEFNNQIRFSFSEIQKSKSESGATFDEGSQMMFAPPQDLIDKDIAALRKFKLQILSHKEMYPDVVLFHGNDLSYFEINNWSGSYFFASDASDDLNTQFFAYMKNYEELISAYAPITVNVAIYRDLLHSFRPDFERTNRILSAGQAIKETLSGKPLRDLLLQGRESTSQTFGPDELVAYFDGERLTVANLFDAAGNPLDFTFVSECLNKQDYSHSFAAKCRVR